MITDVSERSSSASNVSSALEYDSDDMSLTATTNLGELTMVPMEDEDGKVAWHCVAEGEAEKYLPASCKGE